MSQVMSQASGFAHLSPSKMADGETAHAVSKICFHPLFLMLSLENFVLLW